MGDRREYNKKYREDNRERLAAYDKIRGKVYREKNKEVIAAKRKESQTNNIEYLKAYRKQYYVENAEETKQRARDWHEANPEKCAENAKGWVEQNPEKRLEISRKCNRKFRSTPKGNLSSTISKRMNESLRKGMKAGRHWEELVNFTVDQLKAHLEKLFKPGWTWDNYGTVWQIDHKFPIASFNYEKPEDIEFHLCWSLENLQPLGAFENRSKNAKIIYDGHPILMAASGGK